MNRIVTGLLFLLMTFVHLHAQDGEVDTLLNERDGAENPVYKPVIGLSSGVFGFYGDLRNNYYTPVNGDYGYKINVTTYLDPGRFFKLNLFFLTGSLSANERSLSDLSRNLNFKTDLTGFGFSAEYSFDHFIPRNKFLRPFISAGLENIQFAPKADLLDAEGIPYNYWSDGTIRNIPNAPGDLASGKILYRNYTYETDLRSREADLYGLGAYNTSTFSVPVDAGLDLRISERISCRLGTSLHFTFTDYMDNVAYKNTSVKGKKGNDKFSFNYISLQFDLFSEPKSKIVEKLFAEMEFDNVMDGDEDGDLVPDAIDECPGTPNGVAVDTTGCPLDTDQDGIPDYQDKEPDTAPGAWVDDEGRTITQEQYLSSILKRSDAMKRDEVKAYFRTIGKGYVRKVVTEIPDKFKSLDNNRDGYISFEELLQAIDDYFDYKLNFTVQDIYELNNFFFEQ